MQVTELGDRASAGGTHRPWPSANRDLALSCGHPGVIGELQRLADELHVAHELRADVMVVGGQFGSEFVEAALHHLEANDAAHIRATFLPGSTGHPSDLDATLGAAMQASSLPNLACRLHGQPGFDAHDLPYEVTVRYQPIVELRSRRVRGYESLFRGVCSRGELTGDQLLAAARAGGWQHQLDRVGRQEGIRNAAPWLGDQFLFLNALPSSLCRPTTSLDATAWTARRLGVPFEQLVFELVECDQVTDLEKLVALLAPYRERGAKVAIDDVGAGYSSLNLLAALQPDVVKIDRELTRRLPEPGARSVVRAVVGMADELDATVVGEGVETDGQAEALLALGVDWGQGWLFGHPSRAQLT